MAKSYIGDDLMVYHHTVYEDEIEYLRERNVFVHGSSFISIFCTIKGEAIAAHGKVIKKLRANEMIAVYGDNFTYTLPLEKEFDGLFIRIHPSLLNDFDDDKFFLRGLELPERFMVIDLNEQRFSLIKEAVYSIINCAELEFGKKHHMPRINVILSELCIYHDSLLPVENKSTDSISVRIMSYIDRYYTKNIGYKEIIEQFYVSKTTINTICRLSTGKTLQKYIEFCRLQAARRIISAHPIALTKVAQMCGFSTYSTFYRAYLREFGHSPVNDKVKKRNKWPFS